MQTELINTNPHQVTLLISQAAEGNTRALNELMPIVYSDLKLIASGIRHKQINVSSTLNTTSLVNEAWLKLNKWGVKAENRKHFFCITAKAMRQILINSAKQKLSHKRNVKLIAFEDLGVDTSNEAEWMIMLDKILKPIEKQNPRLVDVFQLRYFLGFTEPEIAKALEISLSTVNRDWLIVKKIIKSIMK